MDGMRRFRAVAAMLLADVLLAAALAGGVYWAVYRRPLPPPEDLPEQAQTAQAGQTDWSETFQEHFTQETVVTENGYSSPGLSVQVERYEQGEGTDRVTYYVADIYMASLESFQTVFAGGEYGSDVEETMLDLSGAVQAVAAINGDSYRSNLSTLNGLLVRNGVVYRNNPTTQDICVLYQDGVMETLSPEQFDAQQALERGVRDTWIFGPMLLDSEGKALTEFSTWDYIRQPHPRSAIGYFEPGHYCLVAVDGRQEGYSRGMTLEELAAVFEGLGCKAAYNLDGGHTVFLEMNGQLANHSYNETETITDAICILDLAGGAL